MANCCTKYTSRFCPECGSPIAAKHDLRTLLAYCKHSLASSEYNAARYEASMGRPSRNDATVKWKAWIAALEVVVVEPTRPPWADWFNDLSVRTQNILYDAGITDFQGLCARPSSELMDLRNFGDVSLCEVREKLAQVGLSLND